MSKVDIVNRGELKRLLINILSLGSLQVVNYILPLLTVPYLVRVLGLEYFGLLSFSSATIAYFVLVTDYGFNLSATRQISINRNDYEKVKQIYGSVMIIKIVLSIFGFLILAIIVLLVNKFSKHWDLYMINYGVVVGQVLTPIWFFQGMERMQYITYLNVFAKGFFTVCIFFLVKEQSDYLLVPFLTGLGFVIAGVWSQLIIRSKFNLKLSFQSKDDIIYQMVEGWDIFFSRMAVSLYTISAIFFLGLFSNNLVVGHYAAADKIIQAVKGLYLPVSQSIYPIIGRKLIDNRGEGILFVKRVTFYVGSFMFIVSFILFYFADPIVFLLLGSQYQDTVIFLKMMSFLPFIISLSNMYGVQTMLNLGYKQIFGRILSIAAVIGVVLSLLLVPRYYGIGSVLTVLLVETFVTVVMFIYLKYKLK